MSKKSRKRNKRILAVLGVGAAAAMAAKKKRDAVISDGDKNDNANRTTTPFKKASIADVSNTAKKSTATKTKKNIPQDTQVNTGKKETNKKVRLTLGVGDGGPLKLKDNSIRAKNRKTSSAGIKEPNKPMMASIFPKGKSADNYKADMQDFGRTNQYKSGGRAGYKSGGSIKKSMGKALRGGGKVMK